MASFQGTPAGRLDVSLLLLCVMWKGLPGLTLPNSQQLRTFLPNSAELLHRALETFFFTFSPAPTPGSHRQIPLFPQCIFCHLNPGARLALAPNRLPSHQAPPTSFHPKTPFDGAPKYSLTNPQLCADPAEFPALSMPKNEPNACS